MSEANQIAILAGVTKDLQERVTALEGATFRGEYPAKQPVESRYPLILGFHTDSPIGKRLLAAFMEGGQKGAIEAFYALKAECRQLNREGSYYA